VKTRVLIDASALVALINKRDNFHSWTRQKVANLAMPENL
jgi:predicted nucleic acid-binding protein